MRIVAYRQSKKIQEMTPCLVRPDADNIQKAILDALNGVAYLDDAQVWKIDFEKRYAKIPRVEVDVHYGSNSYPSDL